jgi:predicted amidophosphoribosyltransferase
MCVTEPFAGPGHTSALLTLSSLDVINAEPLVSLKALKLKEECSHCTKNMSWCSDCQHEAQTAPLPCVHCIAASPAFKDASVVADWDDILRKRGQAVNERS